MSKSKNIFSIFKRDVLLYLVNLAIGVLIARKLGPYALGIWGILSLVPSYAEGLGRLKVDLAAVYFIGKKTFKKEDIFINSSLITFLSSLLIITIIFYQFENIYFWLFKNENINYRSFIYILMINIPIHFFYMNIVYFHIANDNTSIYNRMVVLQTVVNITLVLVLLIYFHAGLWSIVLGSLLGTLSALILGALAIKKKIWTIGELNLNISLELLKYGLNFYIGGILGQLLQSGTQLITVSIFAPTQIAFLNQGLGVGRLLNKIIEPINTIMFPSISRSNNKDSIDASSLAFRVALILLLISSLILGISLNFLITFFYGIEYTATVQVVYLLLPGIVFVGACSVLLNYFTGNGLATLLYKLQIIPILIQLIISWYLTLNFGLNGAAFSITIGSFLYGFSILYAYLNISKTSPSNLIPKIKDLSYILNFMLSRINDFF